MVPQDLNYIRASKKEVVNSSDFKTKCLQNVIFDDRFSAAKDWYRQLNYYDCTNKSRTWLKRSCKRYIKRHSKVTNQVAGFFSSIIFWWIAQMVISWIVRKLLEHIFKYDR